MKSVQDSIESCCKFLEKKGIEIETIQVTKEDYEILDKDLIKYKIKIGKEFKIIEKNIDKKQKK